MKAEYSFHAAQFFTATIYEWQTVLQHDQYKNIVIESLQFLVSEKRIELNAFVIMNNHIHLIRQAMNEFTPSNIQASFMKYTAQQIKRSLMKDNPAMLANLKVNKYDREYQIWKREPLSIELIDAIVLKFGLETCRHVLINHKIINVSHHRNRANTFATKGQLFGVVFSTFLIRRIYQYTAAVFNYCTDKLHTL